MHYRERFRLAAPLLTALLFVAGLGTVVAAGTATPNDQYYLSKGSWQQDYDDQWGLKQIGFAKSGSGSSAWDIEDGKRNPVIVAVIDSGLDYYHPDFDRRALWKNPKESLNGLDDDGNGYVDDVFGWDFVEQDNNPWDQTGHGTHVAGIIAATTGNGLGIAGINSGARIMPLRVLNFLGRGYNFGAAEAIHYAVANGARVINLSLGGKRPSGAERRAIEYADAQGVVVVVAAGNEGAEATGAGIAALPAVITVGAGDVNGNRALFSNWGSEIDVIAPGVEILSLRARRTDIVQMSGAAKYQPGSRVVGGPQGWYYRASGTSFAAPFVTGVASLLFANDPSLDGTQVKRMIVQSARDVDPPGVDQFSGYGMLDARAALAADPEFFIDAMIHELKVVQKNGKPHVRVIGTVDADKLKQAWIEIGGGDDPQKWKKVSRNVNKPVHGGELDDLPAGHFSGAKKWTLRLVVQHKNGATREARFLLNLG